MFDKNGLSYLYNNRTNQPRKAKLYRMTVKNAVLENGKRDPDGEKYEFEKYGKDFRCGIWGRNIRIGGKSYTRTNLSENLNTENGGIILYSTDKNVLNIVKIGDKVRYENEDYLVEKVSYPEAKANSEFQRLEQNTMVVMWLT